MQDKEYKNRKNLFTTMLEKTIRDDDRSCLPAAVQRRLHGYTMAMVVFIVFGLLSWIFTRSFVSMGMGLLLAAAIGLLNFMQRREIKRTGVDFWRMEVLEYTFLTSLNKRPTGFYAEALNGPYEGKVCHVALSSSGTVPPIGRNIELCVPGNTVANPIKNIYYVPQYFGIELLRDAS